MKCPVKTKRAQDSPKCKGNMDFRSQNIKKSDDEMRGTINDLTGNLGEALEESFVDKAIVWVKLILRTVYKSIHM